MADGFCIEGWKFDLKGGNQLVRVSECGSGSGSRSSIVVNSQEHDLSHARFFELQRGKKNNQTGRPGAFVEPISPMWLMALCKMHSQLVLPNLQERCATIHLWSDF